MVGHCCLLVESLRPTLVFPEQRLIGLELDNRVLSPLQWPQILIQCLEFCKASTLQGRVNVSDNHCSFSLEQNTYFQFLLFFC